MFQQESKKTLTGGSFSLACGVQFVGREEIAMIGTQLSEALGRYLDLTSDQMKLTASNIANVDTPGYKTEGMNFGAAFSQAMQHLSSGSLAGVNEEIGKVSGLVARPDGNNVSMDREGMQLAKEQLQFKAGVELLKMQYSETMSAIHEDGK
jgi:flagellar basal-body rod protein FlgB